MYQSIKQEIREAGKWNGNNYEFGVCSVNFYDHAERIEICVPIGIYEQINLAIENILIGYKIFIYDTFVEIAVNQNTTIDEIVEIIITFNEIADKSLKYRLLGKTKHFYKRSNV